LQGLSYRAGVQSVGAGQPLSTRISAWRVQAVRRRCNTLFNSKMLIPKNRARGIARRRTWAFTTCATDPQVTKASNEARASSIDSCSTRFASESCSADPLVQNGITPETASRETRVMPLYRAHTKIPATQKSARCSELAPSHQAACGAAPPYMPEQEPDTAKSQQLLPGMGWLTDKELGAVLRGARLEQGQGSDPHQQMVAANAARAEVMRRALRRRW